VVIESKSFDFELVRREEDLLRISENGRGRRFFSHITCFSVSLAAEGLGKICQI